MASLATSLRVPEVYASLALMAGSLLAYVLLRLFVLHWAVPLGLPPVPSAYALPLSSPDKDFVLTWAALSTMWTTKLVFWVVVFLTLGFVPLLAPRALLLVFPWVVFTVFNVTSGYFHFGDQYLFVAAAALFIEFTFGLDQLLRWSSVRATGDDGETVRSDAPTRQVSDGPTGVRTSPSSNRITPRRGRPRPSAGVVILSVGVAILIGGNLFLNPLDPLATPIVADLGAPFPSAFGVDLGPLPDVQNLQQLVSVIPKDAVVAAPLPVFSLVADDPYAYPLIHFANPPYNDSLLPGNESARVGYVLLPYSTPGIDLSPALFGTLYDPSIFGVRGCVSDSEVGGVELFQRGYNGTPEVFGAADPLCPNYFAGGTGLTAEKHASVLENVSSPSGVVVRSNPCYGNATVWTGPGLSLPAGQYSLRIVLNAFNSTQPSCPSSNQSTIQPLVKLTITGREGLNSNVNTTIAHESLRQRQLCSPECGAWVYWNSTLILPALTSYLSVTGAVAMEQYIIQVAYLLFVPVSS